MVSQIPFVTGDIIYIILYYIILYYIILYATTVEVQYS